MYTLNSDQLSYRKLSAVYAEKLQMDNKIIRFSLFFQVSEEDLDILLSLAWIVLNESRDWIFPSYWLGNIRVTFPNFQNLACCEKYLKDNNTIAFIWHENFARIFVVGHFPFLEAHSSLLGTNNVCGQTSEHIFAQNGGYCSYSFDPGSSKRIKALTQLHLVTLITRQGVK